MKPNSLIIKSVMALAIAGSLTACDDDADIQKQQEYDTVKNDAIKNTVTSFNQENKELSDMLKQMKERDPSISSLYYSFDDNGQKQLHIVKDDNVTNGNNVGSVDFENDKQLNASDLDQLYARMDQESTNIQQNSSVPVTNNTVTQKVENDHNYSDYVFPMVAGLTTGMLLSNFMSGGMKNMVNTYHPQSYHNLNNEERKKRHNAGSSSYLAHSLSSNRSVSSSNYSKGVLKAPTLSTRTSGFFSNRGTSARSSGYGGGS